MSRVASITAVAALVAQALAGSAVVKNACDHNVFLWVVDNTPGTMQTVAPGATWSEPYRANPNGGGISIKLGATESHASGITQFEYTLTDTLWYDMSNIDGYPFVDSGITLVPSNPTCRSVVCPAGVQICTAAYNQPKDDWATAACDVNTDLVLELCSHQVGTTPVDVGAPQQEAPAPSSTPEPEPEPSSTYVAPPPPPPSTTSVYVAPPEPTTSSTPPPPPPPPSSTEIARIEPTTSEAPEPAPTPDIKVFTTFVTEVFTVFVRSAAPEPTGLADRMAAIKREHMHKRAEHRHHFHRHANTD